jgi:hypothetical protein
MPSVVLDVPDHVDANLAHFALRIGLEAIDAAKLSVQAISVQDVLNEHHAELEEMFASALSLDNPSSPMSNITRNYNDLRVLVERLMVTKTERRRSTHGGADFEEILGELLRSLVGTDGMVEATGAREGHMGRAKKGDFVISFNDTSISPDERIVVEAKRDQSYSMEKIINEAKLARQNRGAKVALFVYDRQFGEAKKFQVLSRHGLDLVVCLWDQDSRDSDILVEAGLVMAKLLLKLQSESSTSNSIGKTLIDQTVTAISNAVKTIEVIQRGVEESSRQSSTAIGNLLALRQSLIDQLGIIKQFCS